MKRTITEKFDEEGRLVERVTVEDSADPVVLPQPQVYPYPNTIPVPGTWWQSPTNIGGCSACALSGACNCVNPPGAPQVTCSITSSS